MAFGDPYTPGYLHSTCQHGTPLGHNCQWCRPPATTGRPLTVQLGGWRCPGCGTCWSPSVLACHHCPQQTPVGIGEGFTAEPVSDLCVTPTEGGLCGCGEDDGEDEGPCTKLHCDH